MAPGLIEVELIFDADWADATNAVALRQTFTLDAAAKLELDARGLIRTHGLSVFDGQSRQVSASIYANLSREKLACLKTSATAAVFIPESLTCLQGEVHLSGHRAHRFNDQTPIGNLHLEAMPTRRLVMSQDQSSGQGHEKIKLHLYSPRSKSYHDQQTVEISPRDETSLLIDQLGTWRALFKRQGYLKIQHSWEFKVSSFSDPEPIRINIPDQVR
jgi:hypothetical protein